MAEAKRVQLPRLVVFALCVGFLAFLAAVFAIPVQALLEPVGTDVTNKAIKNSAKLPVLMWCLSWPIVLARQRDTIRLPFGWTLGCLLLLLHIAVAFHLGHGWSHEAAWEHTRQVGGYGDGIFVNYAFALVWLADVVWVWALPGSYLARSRWLNWTIHGFLAFVVVNAAVVFASWDSRFRFATFFLGIALVVWYLRREATSKEPTAVDSK